MKKNLNHMLVAILTGLIVSFVSVPASVMAQDSQERGHFVKCPPPNTDPTCKVWVADTVSLMRQKGQGEFGISSGLTSYQRQDSLAPDMRIFGSAMLVDNDAHTVGLLLGANARYGVLASEGFNALRVNADAGKFTDGEPYELSENQIHGNVNLGLRLMPNDEALVDIWVGPTLRSGNDRANWGAYAAMNVRYQFENDLELNGNLSGQFLDPLVNRGTLDGSLFYDEVVNKADVQLDLGLLSGVSGYFTERSGFTTSSWLHAGFRVPFGADRQFQPYFQVGPAFMEDGGKTEVGVSGVAGMTFAIGK